MDDISLGGFRDKLPDPHDGPMKDSSFLRGRVLMSWVDGDYILQVEHNMTWRAAWEFTHDLQANAAIEDSGSTRIPR